MIKTPPKLDEEIEIRPFSYISENCPEKTADYLEYYSPTDSKGKYHPYDTFRYRTKKGLDPVIAWGLTKMSRNFQNITIELGLGDEKNNGTLFLTSTIHRATSIIDRHTTLAALEHMSTQIKEESRLKYLFNDLIEDEAISSSQLEGAATTTIAAKDMLKRDRAPRTMDERMILGNYKMMNFAWKNRNEKLSIELISELHLTGVADIDDDKYTPGVFRKTDDIVIRDQDDNIVHTPPPALGIEKRLKSLCNWVNTCHDDAETKDYLHPLLKAISIHFAIGYEHPFRDGNGRVARALFYWFMFKSDFAALRYIAISTLLKDAAIQYGKSYLYTETDKMDLTYFVDHQCSIITRAVNNFTDTYKKAREEQEQFQDFLWNSGLYGQLTEKQRTIFQVASSGTASLFTITNAKENFGCAYGTAATTLNGLVDLGLFEKIKSGREWHYTMKDKKDIQKEWKQA